jgi:hypothetical protein
LVGPLKGSWGHSRFIPGQAVGVLATGGVAETAGGAAASVAGVLGGESNSPGVGKLLTPSSRPGPLETIIAGTPAPRSRTRTLTSSIRASPRPVSAKVTVKASPSRSAGTIR